MWGSGTLALHSAYIEPARNPVFMPQCWPELAVQFLTLNDLGTGAEHQIRTCLVGVPCSNDRRDGTTYAEK